MGHELGFGADASLGESLGGSLGVNLSLCKVNIFLDVSSRDCHGKSDEGEEFHLESLFCF
tara:strand:+ start:260 stop:439 length:180 start_codon:yes stop_codon:yes gene_type:complete